MPQVYPFRALQYRAGSGDVSSLVSPPYDVLDASQKADLLSGDKDNIVGVDLPVVPAKELGPAEAYANAADRLAQLIDSGVVSQRDTPAMFAYRQTFEFQGERYQRCGMACCVELLDFGPREGGGILPHEHTFGGPKEDRKALMTATGCQTSPVFGLYPDESSAGTDLIRAVMDARDPDQTADLGDGVTHEVWTIDDDETIANYTRALDGEDVFIADGHHRYNTQLNYLHALQEQGEVPADHPARRCMMVLVGMSDPGLAIGPTHRVLGGMRDYTMDRFIEASAGLLNVEAIDNEPKRFEEQMASLSEREHTNVFGLYDYATGLCFACWPATADPLELEHADKPEAWRNLDVALVQHLIVEQICQPELNEGDPIKWAFPHSIEEMIAIGRGEETGSAISGGGRPQLAVIVRPTPLESVRAISLAGEVMPQKSTFFYPKLATGLFLNPLRETVVAPSGG